MTTAPRERRRAGTDLPRPMQTSDRIALYVPSLRGGGAERVMLNLASVMAAHDLRVDLVLPQAEGPYLAEVPKAVRVIDLQAGRVLRSLPALVRYLRRERPRRLIAAMSHANLVAIWARALARTPTAIVASEHGSPPRSEGVVDRLRSAIFDTLCHHFYPGAAVVAVSEGVARHVAASARLEPTQIKVIYNPIVTPDLVKLAQEDVGHPWFAPGAGPVFLSVGRLTRQKDYPTLIRAFAEVARARDARLVILGEGEDRPQLEALVRELGLTPRVQLPGFVGNPFAYMARCSGFVLSSAWEGLPSVLIEAMACGCAVVSTDCESGPREILEGGRWGRLVPVGDAAAMAKALLELVDHPSAPPRAEALARFEPERVMEQYLAVLEEHRRA